MRAILFIATLLFLAAPVLAADSHRKATGPPVEVKRLAPVRSLDASMLPAPPSATTKQDDRRIQAISVPGGGGPALLDLPSPFFTFPGLWDNDQYPPLYRFAVGEKEIVQVQGDRFRITNKCNGSAEDWTFSEFFQDAPVSFEQADVIYDRWGDRMFVMAAGPGPGPGDYSMYIGRWDEPWPGWGYYFVTQMEDDGAIPTSNHSREMRMGLTSDMLYVTADQWSNGAPSAFQYSKIRVFNLANLGAVTDFTSMSNTDSSPAVSIRPAKMHSYAGTSWLINTAPGGDNYYTLWALTGPPASPNLASYNISVSPYVPPEDAWQPDSTRIDLGDCRIGNAAFHADTLWTTFTVGYEPQPGSETAAVRVAQIKASTQSLVFETAAYSPGGWLGYPQIDVDGQGRGLVSFLFVQTTETGYPPSTAYIDFQSVGGFLGGTLAALEVGLDSYSDPGGPPWPWGFVHGAARDPVDNTSMWVGGAYSMGPSPPRWATTLAMMSFEPAGSMTVTQLGNGVIDNYIDGFIHPDSVEYYVTNNGGSMVYWSFSGADTLVESTWEGVSGEPLAPGETDTVVVSLAPGAFGLPQGFYNDTVTFTDCVSGTVEMRTVEVVWAEDYECGGAWASVMWADSLSSGTASHQKRGAFVTPLKDIELCAVTPKLWIPGPQVVTVSIYEADGNQRGALIASQPWIVIPGTSEHIIPMNVVLQKCRGYNITFEWGEANQWLYADMAVNPFPLDLLGAFRVRSGEANGIADPVVPQFELTFSALAVPVVADPAPPGITWSTVPVFQSAARMEIIPMQTLNLSGVSMRGAFPSLPGTLVADAFDTGGEYVTGSGWSIIHTPGLQDHLIPVSEVLYEGRVYGISTIWGGMFDWQAAAPSGFPLPWVVEDWFKVSLWYVPTPGESNVKHMKLHFAPFDTGTPFHLGKPDEPPPHEVMGGSMLHGAYVTANADLGAWALDWFADVPPGSTITARIYQATGNTRGALLCEGSVRSGRDGMNWHKIPISAELLDNDDYDIEIAATGTNLWRWWSDESGMPIVHPGVITVRDGERNGNASITGLLEMQLWACNTTATGIGEPVRPPQFFVSAPYPNPAGRESVIDYSLDRAGTVEIVVYDVAGRRVATVLESTWQPAGPGKVTLNTAGLPAGVYFVKMRMPAQSVSRKITVVR